MEEKSTTADFPDEEYRWNETKKYPLLHAIQIEMNESFSDDLVYEMIMTRYDPTFKKIEDSELQKGKKQINDIQKKMREIENKITEQNREILDKEYEILSDTLNILESIYGKNFEKFKHNYIKNCIENNRITKDNFQENGHYYKAFEKYEDDYLKKDLTVYMRCYFQALGIFNLFNKYFELPPKEKVIKVIGSSDGKIKMKRHKKKVPKSLRRKSLRRKSLRRKSLRRKSLRRKSLRRKSLIRKSLRC